MTKLKTASKPEPNLSNGIKELTPPPPPVAVSDGWAAKVLRAIDAYRHPDRYLTPPPANVAIDHLLDVLALLGGEQRQPLDLVILAKRLTLLDSLKNNTIAEAATTFADKVTQRAKLHAADQGGSSGRRLSHVGEEWAETLRDFLRGIDSAIAGTGNDPRVIRVAPIDQAHLVDLYGGHDVPGADLNSVFVGVRTRRLPDGHPLKSWPEETLLPAGETGGQHSPVAVLGPSDARTEFFGEHRSRDFYLTPTAEHWTRIAADAWTSRRAASMSVYDEANAQPWMSVVARQRATKSRPRKPAAVQLPELPQVSAEAWAGRLGEVINGLLKPGDAFKAPPAGTSLDDLLAVREAMGVIDHEVNHLKWAADRFAARAGGVTYRDDLQDLVGKLLYRVIRDAARLLDAGAIWAARMAQEAAKKGVPA